MAATTLPKPFSRYPMLWLAAWFACGIVIGSFAHLELIVSLIAALVAGACCIAWQKAAVVLLPIIFLSIGAFSFQIETGSIADNRIRRIYDYGRIASGEPVEVEGVIRGAPEPAYGGVFLTVSANSISFRATGQNVSGN